MDAVPEAKLQARERHARILEALARDQFVTVPGMAGACRVSEMTMRRDLDKLAEIGRLERTHGGAASLSSNASLGFDLLEPRFESRTAVHTEEKASIARAAARLIEPEQTIALDIGSSTFALARRIAETPLNVFTSSLKIAAYLAEKRPNVYVPAGQVAGSEPSLIGHQAVKHLRTFRFDVAFIGVSSVSENGFYDYSLEDANIKRTLIECAERAVVLIDSSKFGRISVEHVAGFEAVDTVISEARPPAWLRKACAAAQTEIILA
ncbi:MAG: DeoR/GlpR family DNA-binding transcription regulator [Rhodospirillales bacterium]